MKCIKCGGEWNPPLRKALMVCPFCNADQTPPADVQPENAVKTIVEQYGEEILLEDKKLTGLLSDFINKDSQLKKLLTLAVRDHIPSTLYNLKSLSDQEREYKIKEIALHFMEDNFLVEEAAYKAVNCYADSLGYKKLTIQIKPAILSLPEKILTNQRADKLTGANIDIPHGYTAIGVGAFESRKSIKRITIPNSMVKIGDSAFWMCSGLETVVIPNGVTAIGNCAFAYCECLKKITIPESVTSIGHGVFQRCDSLENIVIPKSVTSIGHSSFWMCGSLERITIADSVTSIGHNAFDLCGKLTIDCSKDSYAYKYCQEKKIKARII